MSVLLGPGGGTAFGQWGNYFGPIEELLLAVWGTASGQWGNCFWPIGNCFRPMGELLSADGGTEISHSVIIVLKTITLY